MRLYLRFILPLFLAFALVAFAIFPLANRLTMKWFFRDIDARTKLIASSVQESLVTSLNKNSGKKIIKLFNQLVQDERLYAVGLCNTSYKLLYKTRTFPDFVTCENSGLEDVEDSIMMGHPKSSFYVSYHLVKDKQILLGRLILIHDITFIQKRSDEVKRYMLYAFLVLLIITSLLTVIIAKLSWKRWVRGIRSIIKREENIKPNFDPELKPLEKDIKRLIRELEKERKVLDESNITWNPKALKEILNKELAGDEILIVSNREPYIHIRKKDKIEVHLPASGLVTALEPVMRACSGTWIAHGSGNADREVVDEKDHVKVPPHNPSYQIRRVWLTKEEEEGYYYSFSNEGLWPLCHIAHTRPIFRSGDWQQYVLVNQKFAKAVMEEAKTNDPVILVQDYHLALLPQLIKKQLPDATIITFWHIPWPNPEVFGICPWRDEILEGLLGSSILGFHTRYHCNNFIDTVDRFIESRIDRETSTISYGGKLTKVQPYPISIEWPVRWLESQKSIKGCGEYIRNINNLPLNRKIGLGVDRLDYTKGIIERFLAIERFLELNPEWIGKLTFIQIAAPSRSTIEEYKRFDAYVRETVKRINSRFSKENYEPICLKIEHHEPEQVFEYFRGVDFCFVSSLHDGMNLVAKEFISARDDEKGVLILSQFTGAARELPQSLIVNPYNIDQCAYAIKVALEMPENEQKNRMRTMRGLIQEFNVYRWAGRMLIDASRIRQHNRFLDKFGNSDLDSKLPPEA